MRPGLDDILAGVQRLLQNDIVPALLAAPFVAEQALYATVLLEYAKKLWPRLHLALAEEHGDLRATLSAVVAPLRAESIDGGTLAAAIAADLDGATTDVAATTLDALAVRVPGYARALVEAFWPGPLTLVCHQQSSLQWDLGDTRGTVAVRMPDHEVAREILERTGPLAVSSANKTGMPAATDADQAEDMLGEDVAVIIDAGESPGGEASTIVDVTGSQGRVLRRGALSLDDLNAVLEPLGATLTDEG
jgi:hypothetical protein